MRNKHLTNSSYYRKMPISDWKYAENKMNAIIKLLMGLGCLGMYLGWRYAPETAVVGIGLNTLAIYGSLAVVAGAFVLAMMFGADESGVVDREVTKAVPHESEAGVQAASVQLDDPNEDRFTNDPNYDLFSWRSM
ncbi:hypothetical protein [Acidovorax sp. 94]|uniref:hypothetical protein n=1 Tax=Acidovorax sp. 94 TaxID=2135633 RepID=UPI0011C4678D|nr:hypothetical protein [Acidovorax sp. 94]